MLNKLILSSFFLILLIGFNACSNVNSNNSLVSIEVYSDSLVFDGMVYLQYLAPDKTTTIDSISANNTSRIVFKVRPIQLEDIYIIRFANNNAITVIVDSIPLIKLRILGLPYQLNYQIENSPNSLLVKRNNDIINKHIEIFEKKYSEYRNTKRGKNFDSYRKRTDSILRQNQIDMYNELKNSIESHPSSLASLLAIYSKFGDKNIFDIEYDFATYQLLADSLISSFPENTHAIFFNNIVEKKKINMELKEKRERKLDKNQIFPDIMLNDLDNNKYRVKETRAKIIIIYLWKAKYKAFWDNNVYLKRIYNTIARDQLEIIGISFEKDKLSWANYCKMEKMKWINLISGPENEALINPISVYPRIFVLDSSFKILNNNADTNDIKTILNEKNIKY